MDIKFISYVKQDITLVRNAHSSKCPVHVPVLEIIAFFMPIHVLFSSYLPHNAFIQQTLRLRKVKKMNNNIQQRL